MRRALVVLAVLGWLAAPAAASAPSTVTITGDATHDNRVTGAPEPPLGVKWAVRLGDDVSYPVVAEGKVFVTVRPANTEVYGTELVALDLASGAVLWRRPVAGTYYWSAAAYDQGRLIVVNFDGRVTALSPATGGTLWSTKLDQSSFGTAPVAYDGHVYLTGAGSGMTVYSLRASNGSVEWQKPLASGAGTPAVDAGSVYVSMVCQHAVALTRSTGALRWSHAGTCAGGGEATPALHQGRVYPQGDNGAIYSAATGETVGAADFHGAMAFADGTAYVPWLNGLLAVDAASWVTRWRVTGSPDTGLNHDAPLVTGNHVYVASEAGYVAAIQRSNGAVAWCASTAGLPVQGATGNLDRPDSGLGAGGGMLLVPAGGFLVAYANGGAAPAPCGSTSGTGAGGSGSPVAPVGPSLTLSPARDEIHAGRPVGLRGRLANTPSSVAAVRVTLERDPWPFDDRWTPAGSTVTAGDGSFAVAARPGRNTRYRARAAGLTSAPATVYADLTVSFRRRPVGAGRFRETLTISGPRGTHRPASRVHFYLIRSGTRTARHKARSRLRRVAPGRFRAAATLRFLSPRRSTIVLACYREPTPDPWGRASDIDPVCGRRRLTLSAPARAATANATAATADATRRFAAN